MCFGGDIVRGASAKVAEKTELKDKLVNSAITMQLHGVGRNQRSRSLCKFKLGGVLNMKLMAPAKAARQGVNPFTKDTSRQSHRTRLRRHSKRSSIEGTNALGIKQSVFLSASRCLSHVAC